MRADFPSSFLDWEPYLTDGDPETHLAKSLKDGEFSAWIRRFDAIPPEMLERATVDDFKVAIPAQRSRGSELLHIQPIDDARACCILSEFVPTLRLAQIWEQGFRKKVNRFSIKFRLTFYYDVDAYIDPGFGDEPFSPFPEIEKLRAFDWFGAVLARLLRNWHLVRRNLAQWEWLCPMDVRGIVMATRKVAEIRTVGGATYTAQPFPWSEDQRRDVTISMDGDDSVLGGKVLARLTKVKSVRQASEAFAYLMFREFLLRVSTGSITVELCKHCNGVFAVTRRRRTFCCDACHISDSSDAHMRKRYLSRAEAGVSSLEHWKQKPSKHDPWRQYLERDLLQFCTGSHQRPARFLTDWVTAAHAPHESEAIHHLMARWYWHGVDVEEYVFAWTVFSRLLELIREVESIQASL